MSKIQMLRKLINERLTSAAGEIFEIFGRTIVEYEEELSRSKLEIDRQRRLLDMTLKPQIKLENTVFPEEQERSSSLDQEKEELLQIKEEQEELQPVEKEGEQLQQQQEDNVIQFTFYQTTCVTSRQNQDQTQSTLPDHQTPCFDVDQMSDPQPSTSTQQMLMEPEGGGGGSVVSEPAGDCQLVSSDCSETERSHVGRPGGEESYRCSICGQAFLQRSLWAWHLKSHRMKDYTADKSYWCHICGKRLTRLDGFQKHLRIHTGEKPYCCNICCKRFSDNSNYKRHIRTHTGEKPHRCRDCGKGFESPGEMKAHIRLHHRSLTVSRTNDV